MLIARFTSCCHELAITESEQMSYDCGCLRVFFSKIALIIHDFSAAIAFGPAPANSSSEFHFASRKAFTHKRLSSLDDPAVVHLIFSSINLLLI